MYSSNGNIDPILYSDQQQQPFCCSPLFRNDSNPTSKPPNSLAPTTPSFPPPPPLTFPPFFSSPFKDNNGIFHQSLAEPVIDMEVIPSKGSTTTKQIPIRRCRNSNKRDRHSKINTARGPRDRRMRLSLDVAKRFFGLQDMLGFDKASKTVEWLLNQAKEGIKQLERGKNHSASNSTSECEGVSGLDEVVVSAKNEDQEGIPSIRRKIKLSHRKGPFHVLARELRLRARERARERTKQKIRSRQLAADDDESKQWGSWNLLEKGEESNSQSQNVTTEAEEPSSQAIRQNLWTVDDDDMANDDSLVISKWSPSMIFNSLHNTGLLHEHQFAEFQSLGTLGKHWESYNNHI